MSHIGLVVTETQKNLYESTTKVLDSTSFYPCIFTSKSITKWLPVVNHEADKCY